MKYITKHSNILQNICTNLFAVTLHSWLDCLNCYSLILFFVFLNFKQVALMEMLMTEDQKKYYNAMKKTRLEATYKTDTKTKGQLLKSLPWDIFETVYYKFLNEK